MDDEQREQAFLTRLWDLQRRAGMKDATLARHLGVHSTYLIHLRAGRREHIGFLVALRAMRLFPALGSFLSADLRKIRGALPQDSEVKAS